VIGRGGVGCSPPSCGISATMDEGGCLEVLDCREEIFGLRGVIFGHRGRLGCGLVGRLVGMMLVLRILFRCFLQSEIVECCRSCGLVDFLRKEFLRSRVLLSLCISRGINIETRETGLLMSLELSGRFE
jgi:hypothetical protein